MLVMRSEIPQLEVVTAIPDAESEDFLAQLLYSQGWSIVHRALDTNSIILFMRKRGIELRTVIVYKSDFPGFGAEIVEEFASPTVTFISLDSINFTSHEIMLEIRGKLRSPMLHPALSALVVDDDLPETALANFTPSSIKRVNRPAKTPTRERNIIAVTGSTGAPGRTRFATVLAEELSQQVAVLLIDADIRSHGISNHETTLKNNQIEILPLDRESRPTQIPDGNETTVVDLGTLPGLAEAVNDRRWHGSLVNNVLDRASHLVYLSKSTSSSMAELTAFLREYPLLLKRLPVTYVCVLAGHSRELREWESKFLALTAGENRHILRESQLELTVPGGLMSSIRFGSPKRKEIAKIAISLR